MGCAAACIQVSTKYRRLGLAVIFPKIPIQASGVFQRLDSWWGRDAKPVCVLPGLPDSPQCDPGHGPFSHELAQKRQTMPNAMGPTGVSDMYCPGIPHSPLGGQFKLLKVRPDIGVGFLLMILAITHLFPNS